ncbi:hypothetical protein QJS04_geneDACA016834 [Acorus gramineus]|uniref:Uncharacterized protein n=1 Tax=Acorus gramineus TaxID=55184 RepID=A0AAV9ASK4_ACOGR|nr:hypothetical protein QJS04_geneDACA016834 [Acorus gramineus]
MVILRLRLMNYLVICPWKAPLPVRREERICGTMLSILGPIWEIGPNLPHLIKITDRVMPKASTLVVWNWASTRGPIKRSVNFHSNRTLNKRSNTITPL